MFLFYVYIHVKFLKFLCEPLLLCVRIHRHTHITFGFYSIPFYIKVLLFCSTVVAVL